MLFLESSQTKKKETHKHDSWIVSGNKDERKRGWIESKAITISQRNAGNTKSSALYRWTGKGKEKSWIVKY
jgi:hypothetical protein